MKYNNRNLSLRESVPIPILKRLIRFYDQLPLRTDSINKREIDNDPYIESLKKYLNAMESGGGVITVQYRQRGSVKSKTGRYFAETKTIGTSLQGMPREIRHTLAKDTMDDIDFKSCHVVLLRHICFKHGLPCKTLSDIITNRKKHEDDLIKVGITEPKVEILRAINWSKPIVIDNAPSWWNSLTMEVTNCRDELAKLPEYASHLEYAKQKTDYNIEGSFLNLILCDYENRACQHLAKFFINKGIDVYVNCFDGLMVAKQTERIWTELIPDINKYLFKNLGIPELEVIIKPMNDAIDMSKFVEPLTDEVVREASEFIRNTGSCGGVHSSDSPLQLFQVNDQLRTNVDQFLGHSNCPVCRSGILTATMDHGGLQVACGNSACQFVIPRVQVPIPAEYQHLTHYFQFNFNGSITINNITNNYYGNVEGLSPMPEGMTNEQTMVWEATLTGGGKARLFAHVAGDRMKFDGKSLWMLENAIWVPYSDRAEKSRLRQFEMLEVFPFVKQHKPPNSDRQILRFDGDIDCNDLEKLRAIPSLRDIRFMDKLDRNPDWLSFSDGVFDLSTGEFMELKPEMMISKTVGYPFPRNPGPNHNAIVTLFQRIHPNDEIRDYFIRSLASALHGSRLSRSVLIWSGASGRNGKTLLSTVLRSTFGDYFMDLPSGYLQKVSDGTTPDPITIELRNKRLVISSEPQDGRKLASDVVKRLTGGDVARARNLYEGGAMQSFTLNVHLSILANKKPPIDGNDGGVQDRIRSIPFESRFVDNPANVSEENHIYLADESLKVCIEDWGPDLMYYLLQHYDHNWDGTAPECITAATTEYLAANSPVVQFVQDTYEQTTEKGGIKSDAVVDHYIVWAQRNGVATKIPTGFKRDLDLAFKGRELDKNTRRFTTDNGQQTGWGGWKQRAL
jgi:P4 family phage/plasmid primase-like protien